MSKTARFIIEIIVILALLIIFLVLPPRYINKTTERMNAIIIRLMNEIVQNDFDHAEKTLKELQEEWEKGKNIRAVTLEEEYVMDMDNCLTQCEAAVKIRHQALAYQHASVVKHLLEESRSSIAFTFWNVF